MKINEEISHVPQRDTMSNSPLGRDKPLRTVKAMQVTSGGSPLRLRGTTPRLAEYTVIGDLTL
ncbi:uncharacterized protein METZ01_LOCUS246804 [marine metagenome]|uniref:Uncharacterized protein n=1 Tax=marine metagenome TaxID=408172 RepID=A0A382I2S0_9ZZZZ